MSHSPNPNPTTLYTTQPAHQLAASPVEYLSTLASGLNYVAIGVTMQALMPICIVIISLLLGAINATAILGPYTFDLLAAALSTLASFIAAVGWWRVSERDPSLRDTHHSNSVRRDIRRLMVVGVVVALITAVLSVLTSISTTPSLTSLARYARISKTMSLAIIVAQFFYAMRYLKLIAMRTEQVTLPAEITAARKAIILYFTVGWIILIGPLLGLVAYANIITKIRYAVLNEYKLSQMLNSELNNVSQ